MSPGSRPARRAVALAMRSSLEAGGAAPYPRAARPPAWCAAAFASKASGGGAASFFMPWAAQRPARSPRVLSRQRPLVIHRAEHAQRGVPAFMVVVLDPGRDPGPGGRLVRELLDAPCDVILAMLRNRQPYQTCRAQSRNADAA